MKAWNLFHDDCLECFMSDPVCPLGCLAIAAILQNANRVKSHVSCIFIKNSLIKRADTKLQLILKHFGVLSCKWLLTLPQLRIQKARHTRRVCAVLVPFKAIQSHAGESWHRLSIRAKLEQSSLLQITLIPIQNEICLKWAQAAAFLPRFVLQRSQLFISRLKCYDGWLFAY